jgi:putative tryptophan/tyrosine transport system substrate-binding protein
MLRRTCLLLGVYAVFCWGAFAQQPGSMRRIGILCPTSCNDASYGYLTRALQTVGLVEGRNIEIVYRDARGDVDRLPGLAAELVGQKVDVLVTLWGTAAALAAKRATNSIPIVAVAVGDPVAAGLVVSLARPGGNVTGVSTLALTLEGKRLELIKELKPTSERVAVLWDPENPYSSLAMREIEATAKLLRLQLLKLRVKETSDLDTAFSAIVDRRADALLVPAYLLLVSERERIVSFAASKKIPAIYSQDEFVRSGGLISYGIEFQPLYTRAASYVERILKGSNPAEIPVEQPTIFKLVVNLKLAKAIGIEIPDSLLARADEVVE